MSCSNNQSCRKISVPGFSAQAQKKKKKKSIYMYIYIYIIHTCLFVVIILGRKKISVTLQYDTVWFKGVEEMTLLQIPSS